MLTSKSCSYGSSDKCEMNFVGKTTCLDKRGINFFRRIFLVRVIQSTRCALQHFLTPIQGKNYKYHSSSFTCIWFDLLRLYKTYTYKSTSTCMLRCNSDRKKKDVNRISVKINLRHVDCFMLLYATLILFTKSMELRY